MSKLITNDSSMKIYQDRYEYQNEGVEGTLLRVANYIGSSEEEKEEFFNVMASGKFLPAGRTITNSGIGKTLTLNNCFNANHVPDSIDGIFDKVKLGARTHKAGGGIGYDFSLIRPNGTPTSNEAIASGVTSFMDVFDAQTKTILQGSRRGANLSCLNIYHPEIYSYLDAKSYDAGKLTQFNMSIMVDDEFMNAVLDDTNIFLHYPVYDENSRIIKDESKWLIKKEIKATELWDLIMRKAYDTGEYGIFFYDNINNDNPTWYAESIVTSNPCGEYLSGVIVRDFAELHFINSEDYMGACNLGSIHFHRFVKNPFTSDAQIDYDDLRQTIITAVKFLDNIIDINIFPDKAYENYQKNMRTIGLGTTGLHNLLVMMGMEYGDEESVNFVDDLYDFVARESYLASIQLAKVKMTFHFLDKEKFISSGFIQKHLKSYPHWDEVVDGIRKYGIRNARIISNAPVGTMSLTFGDNCSSGIEPSFQWSMDRNVKMGGQSEDNVTRIKVYDYAYDKFVKMFGKDAPFKYKSALELGVDNHLAILNRVAYHTDMSVSKTINIPTDYSFEKTKDVYMTVWKNKGKGATIFRPNALRSGIFNTSDTIKEVIEPEQTDIPRGYVIESSDDLIGRKVKLQTGCGSLHVSAFFDDVTGEPMEIYLNKGGTGGCQGYMGGLSRMVSLALRGGVHYTEVIEQLKSVHACPSYVVRNKTHKDTAKGNNCSGAIGFAIEQMIKEIQYDIGIDSDEVIEKVKVEKVQLLDSVKEKEVMLQCPDCKQMTLGNSGGCLTCVECGYSKCS